MPGIDWLDLAFRIPALIFAITVHEFSHARMALAFGDRTAEQEGRVTLNPLSHLDPIGSIGLLLGTFGWGRPVPVNKSQLNHPRADFLVSAAGPLSNAALALLAAVVFTLLPAAVYHSEMSLARWLPTFLVVFVQMNLGLCFFNLIPLFPLDGSHMVENLLPLEKAWSFKQFNQSFGIPILFALILIGQMGPDPLGLLVGVPTRVVSRWLLSFSGLF